MTSLVFTFQYGGCYRSVSTSSFQFDSASLLRHSVCTKYRKDISVHGSVITTSGFAKKTAAIYSSCFDFDLQSSLAYQFASAYQISYLKKDHRRRSYDVMSVFDTAADDVSNQLPVPL